MAIDANKFDTPVRFLKRTKVTGTSNQVVENFIDTRMLWGELLDGAIGEQISEKVVEYAESYIFNTWYCSDLSNEDRILLNGDEYNILAAQPKESNRFLVLKLVKIYD